MVTVPESDWRSVDAASGGRVVAVADTGTDRAMYSDDNGASWTAASAPTSGWKSVTHGPDPSGANTFVAVAADGSDRVMTSTDGSTWTAAPAASASDWRAVAWGEGVFAAVAYNTTAAMTSNVPILTQGGPGTGAAATANHMYIIAPTSTTPPAQYVLHYNTTARITGGNPWGIWAKKWNPATTDIDLNSALTKSQCESYPSALGGLVCNRPAAIGGDSGTWTLPFRLISYSATSGGGGDRQVSYRFGQTDGYVPITYS
jgi:hypothetical protein